MEEFAAYQSIKPPQFPQEEEKLKCPRCDSLNTKFCYYNNYNLSQPRHYCKDCKRYWTKGGSLRNIPLGGSRRKTTKRLSSSATRKPASSPSDYSNNSAHRPEPGQAFSDQVSPVLGMGGGVGGFGLSFSSLMASEGQFGHSMGAMNGSGYAGFQLGLAGTTFGLDPGTEVTKNVSEGFLGIQNGNEPWSSDGWPDLAIYTPPNPTFE